MNRFFKKWTNGACLLWVIFLITACQNDHLAILEARDGEGVTLTFCVNNDLTINTRSQLSPEENNDNRSQHVKYVQLYIFRGTEDNAVCVASEDVKWSDYFAGELPVQTAEMKYRVKYMSFVSGEVYSFLAVGMDDKADVTYGFPDAFEVGTTTLGEAIATLANAGSAEDPVDIQEQNWKDICESELFAGRLNFIPDSNTTRTINLYRRVAGVIAWFKNIPDAINDDPIVTVRMMLYKTQNKGVPLIPRSQSPVFLDYEDNPLGEASGSRELFSIAVPENHAESFAGTTYMLPMPAPVAVSAEDYTMKVELVSENGSVRAFRTRLGSDDPLDDPTGGGTGIIDPESPYRFPIIANHIYQIGSKDNPIDFTGNEVKLTVKPWNTIDHDVVFPPAGLGAYFVTLYNRDKYIFNCMNANVSAEDKAAKTITIVPSSNSEKEWTLTIPEECSWLHFVDTDDTGKQTFSKEIIGNTIKDVTLYLNDYVEQRDYSTDYALLGKDYREVVLTLTTRKLGRVMELPVRQYNAITVQGAGFAISRLDVGAYFDYETGEAVHRSEEKNGIYQWGYFSTHFMTVYGAKYPSTTDGQWNIQQMGSFQNTAEIWPGSAGWYCCFSTSELDNAGNELTNGFNAALTSRTLWYLPAKDQNYNMMVWYNKVPDEYKKCLNLRPVSNGSVNTVEYWSSTTTSDVVPYRVFACRNNSYNIKASRSSWYRMRPARNFDVSK